MGRHATQSETEVTTKRRNPGWSPFTVANLAFPLTVAVLASAANALSGDALPQRAVNAGRAPSDNAPALRFDSAKDFAAWQAALRNRLVKILALPDGPRQALRSSVAPEPATDLYAIERVEFDAEPGQTVPGYLLRPRAARPPFPVMICLQGHSPGMHISIGRGTTPKEQKSIEGGRDIALQAVRNGWAALAIEQRAFGLRAEKGVSCQDAALRALLRGRPITGQRVWDVMRAIDFLATQPDLDMSRVGCMGNSMGGTVSFYAACVDPRIRLAVVSCSFCTFADSWLSRPHCACGYLPGILQIADMPGLAGLIAPQHLLIVAGRKDALARFEGVEEGFRLAQRAFAAAGAADHVRLLAADGEHRFYPELAWPAIGEVVRCWK